MQEVSDRPFYTRQVPASASKPVVFRLEHVPAGSYRLQVRKTGYRHNDPLSLYIDMGLPEALDPDQLAQLQQATADAPEQDKVVRVDEANHEHHRSHAQQRCSAADPGADDALDHAVCAEHSAKHEMPRSVHGHHAQAPTQCSPVAQQGGRLRTRGLAEFFKDAGQAIAHGL